ncbi:MAG TPA: hypothetical protein VFO77_16855, partial [Actinoplanes sp.]|nr:hypothetical protein [Actinoplanes sp.]
MFPVRRARSMSVAGARLPRLSVEPERGQWRTQPVGQVGDQFPLVGAEGHQPVRHPVERVPGLGQLAWP